MNQVFILQLPKIFDPRGNLTVAEEFKNVPFRIQSAEWKCHMPAGSHDKGKASKPCLFAALAGSVSIQTRNGKEEESFILNRPDQALYIDRGTSYDIHYCSSGVVILTLSEN
mgnify:FL=1